MGKVLQFPTRPELIEVDPDEIAIVETRPAVDPRPRRADPTGTIRAALARARRRVWFETTHLPRRGWRLVRYFFRGVIGHRDDKGEWVGGWLGLLMWCLALREREDARAVADENPGKQLNATQKADRIAVWHAGIVVVPHVAAGVAAEHYLGEWWLALVPLIVGTTIYGWRTDPNPPGPLEAFRPGDITVETLNGALRAVGILREPTVARPNPDGVRLMRLPRIVGGGQEIVFDLPASVKASAADVVRERARLAASLAVPLPQIVLEPGEHPGRVVLWYSRVDPFSGTPKEHPLLDRDRWSVFDPIPFGTDARSRPVSAPIVGTHWLIGAVPNAGKTSAARGLTAGAVLDPDTDLYVFDGKQGKDWAALTSIAEQYESGPVSEQSVRLRDLLVRLIAEGDRRFQYMKSLPDEQCPDNAITPELAEAGMRFVWLVIDEAHRHLADPAHGAEITQLLIDYIKGYRACGFGLLICTQDAEAGITERFTALRRVTSTRFGLRVMDWLASNMILGDSMNTRGWNAADILPSQKGTGILRADLEAEDATGQVARMIRTYYLDNPAWRAVCETGAALRQRRHAVSEIEPVEDERLTATELLERFRLCAPDTLPVAVADAQAVGEWLSSRGVRSERNGAAQRVRSRVAVEVAVGLPPGGLEVSGSRLVDGPVTPADTPADSGPDTPLVTPVEV